MRSLLHLIAPPLCAVCAEPCDPEEDVCADCVAAIGGAPGGTIAIPGVDHAWAATTYDGTGRRLVAQLKFGGRLRLARVAARAISEGMPPAPANSSIVPVPPDPLRHRIRGFDPADAIARELARATGLPLAHCLARRHGRRQVGRSRSGRLAAGPRVRPVESAPAAAILLDDVVTTGSTLAECARALRVAGCRHVLALAFARA